MTPTDGEGPHRPFVVAHRGSSDEVAEHTLRAYHQALDDGADALECDVRLTRDGHLVCVHDRRLERTSDGRGVVSTKRLDQLQDLDWGSWKNPWTDLDDEAELIDAERLSVLTLRELLTMVRDVPRQVELLIETKHPTRYSGWVERRLVDLLEEFGWLSHSPERAPAPVRVLSYSQLSLRRMTRWAPLVPLAWVLERELPARVRRGALPRGVGHVAAWRELVRANPDWVHLMQRKGYGVYVWVVNATDDIRLCQELGVDAIITDRPRFVREVLDTIADR
jgi:glycerophosphoryl diester phosphodiesterase